MVSAQAATPWTLGSEEDRRFRRIVLQALTISLLTGAIMSSIEAPLPEPDFREQAPARRVRLLAEPATPVARAEPVASPAVIDRSSPAEKPAAQPMEAPVVTPTPRQKAAQSGVLAMSDVLRELQAMAPQIGYGSPEGDSASPAAGQSQQGSGTRANGGTLTADISKGSGGIAGGVDHQAALGEGGLPARAGGGPSGVVQGSGAVTGEASSGPSSALRSQEQIQEVLDGNKGAMYTLYNRELRRDASLQGRLVLSITVAPQGHVTRCVVVSNELDSEVLEQQLIALVRSIDFGAIAGAGAVTTKIPIEFFPQ